MSDTRIRVLSLNCWGLKYISKQLEARIDALTDALKQSSRSYDIIALQELWVSEHYQKVKEAVALRLPYSKFFYSGVIGAGLAVFSRFPIVSSSLTTYCLNGQPFDLSGSDWYGGKSASSVVILHPLLGEVQVFNTHLHAGGTEYGPEWKSAHRVGHAWELAKLVRDAAEIGRYVLVNGDLNCRAESFPMAIILEHGDLVDAWEVTHPNVDPLTVTSPQQALEQLGVTLDSHLNSWRSKGAEGWGERIDYCLYRQAIRPGKELPTLKAISCKVAFTNGVPEKNFSYSDHFGVETTFNIEPMESVQSTSNGRKISQETLSTTIQILKDRHGVVCQRTIKEFIICGIAIAVLIGQIVGVVWLPQSWFLSIFVLLAAVMGGVGTTFFYEGFLFGNWEKRVLLNMTEELEVYREGQQILAT